MFSSPVYSANLVQSFSKCSVRAAVPVNLRVNEYSTNNCMRGKIRNNQPFGLYIQRDGVLKWDTLHSARYCQRNYFHHVRCNIIAVIPQIENSLDLRAWRSCSWRYIVNQPVVRLRLTDDLNGN